MAKHSVCRHGVLIDMYCEECEAEAKAKAKAAQAGCYVRIVLKGGQGQIDIAQPEGFNLQVWCAIVKGDGAVKTDTLNLPYENILFCCKITDPSSPEGMAQALTTQPAPRGAKSN